MHEYSIVASLIDRVQAEADACMATQVHRLHVRIGEYAGVETELLATAFETFRERTICDGAVLEIESVPASWACRDCDRPIARGDVLRCPSCGSPAQLASGDEIILARVEMETNHV